MESVAKGDSKLSPSAAAKKLKQTRLPFQILSGSPVALSEASKTTPTRKRKPSIEADVARATKIGRTSEAKENVKHPADAVVVLDEESTEIPASNSSAEVQIVEENSVESPAQKIAESNGESATKEKDDRIMIKFPLGKKKGRKSSAGDEGSAPEKKKVSKKEKKQRKTSKKNKEEEPAAESITIDDDSDLSDVENKDDKKQTKAEESSGDMKKQDTVGVQPEPETEVVECEKTSEKSVDVAEKASEESSEVEKVVVDELTNVVSDEQINESKKKVEDEAVTPRRTRLPRAASQKTTESGSKKDEETPKRNKSAAKKGAAEKKSPKGQKSTAEVSSEPGSKPESESKQESAESSNKPIAGALDKMFAKIQTEGKAKPAETTEIQKTPEKKLPRKEETPSDVEPQEGSVNANPNTSAISVSICLDDSTDAGADADDEENVYMLCTPNSKERSLLAENKSEKKLTPKQLARRKEAEQRQAAKQQELEEKKKKKQEEKEAKLREKEEQELQRKKEREEKEEQKRKEREEKEEQKRKEKEEKEEQKRKEREEKEEQKRKEREEKERKRLAEIEAKNEEKRKKEEQREEERKKKEEEKEAEEKRKQKTAQAFQSFFVKKPSASKEMKQSDDENSMDRQSVGDGGETVPRMAFMPFCVKGDMRLAPVCRVVLEAERKKRLEQALTNAGSEKKESRAGLYLEQLKSKDYVAGKGERTWTTQDDDADEDDVMIVDDNVCHQIEVDPAAAPARRYRAKFFLFEENRRPPYRGTWRKRSAQIKPRRPFVQDTKFFDYEVDSDDEWEEEEPGESLHGSDDEKDVDPEEDYEVDNDFFVPHGHLSDEEMQAEDDVMEDNSPETQKAKLKIMQQEFAAEMKKKTEKIKPRLIGCLWETPSGDGPECSAVIWEILKARAMLFDPEEPISFTVQKNEPESNSSSPLKEKEVPERKPKQVKLVDEGVKELITLIHGSALNRKFLIKEFLAYWAKRRDEGETNAPQYGIDSIKTKILEVASWRPCPDEGPMQNKMCWYVNKEALVRYGLTDLKIPTGWEFILKPITKSKREKKAKKDDETNGEDEGDQKPETESPKDKEKNDRLLSTPSSASKQKPAPATPAASTSITKFTKKLSEDDKRKQFAKEQKSAKKSSPGSASKKSAAAATSKKANTPKSAAKAVAASPTPSSEAPKPAAKKRVQLLMSVPRGQSINQTTKSNLISQFLAKGTSSSSSSDKKNGAPEAMEVDPPVANGNHGGQATEPGDVIVLED